MVDDIKVAAFTGFKPAHFKDIPSLNLPSDFKLTAVDETLISNTTSAPAVPAVPAAPKHRHVLNEFRGPFVGSGFNTIFRPSHQDNREAADKNTDLKDDKTKGSTLVIDKTIVETGLDDNILELNLTLESLVFTPKQIGKVPNRGFKGQPDIVLHGIPYVQTVWDVTNPNSGLPDDTPRAIHFEPGMFLAIPSTKIPNSDPTICRMASIPHGTTINASGKPATVHAGQIDFEPFPIKPPAHPDLFKQTLNIESVNMPRYPAPDLLNFKTKGTITQSMLDDPVNVLRAINKTLGTRITETQTFTVETPNRDTDNGIANIPFLVGDGPSKPNANVTKMKSTFWVQTVTYDIEIPKLNPGASVTLKPTNRLPEASLPEFVVTAPMEGLKNGGKATVPSIQIQYAQNVMLRFGPVPFDWPHVSVASLVPLHPIPVDLTKLKNIT
jgi:hypothetical protein